MIIKGLMRFSNAAYSNLLTLTKLGVKHCTGRSTGVASPPCARLGKRGRKGMSGLAFPCVEARHIF